MCVVSNVGDFYTDKFKPYSSGVRIGDASGEAFVINIPVTRQEFDALRNEVLEMKQLLLKAKEIDEKTGQPNCENESKIALLKAVAKEFNISLDEVFGSPK